MSKPQPGNPPLHLHEIQEAFLMGKHSSLGPIDPQIGGVPAHGIIEEFRQAQKEIAQNQLSALVWQPIIAKYTPTLIGQCQKAIQWANDMVKDWATPAFKIIENQSGGAYIQTIRQMVVQAG